MRPRGPAALALLLALAAVAPIGAGGAPETPCAGTITAPAEGTTVISVQGFRGGQKTPARLVAVGPRGQVEWVHRSGREEGIVWSYDVDPLPDGNLFVTATKRNRTVFYELDPRTRERVWSETLPLIDTHDADLLGEDRILIANMRNYNETAGRNEDRLLIYNRTEDRVVWEWPFRGHFPRSGGGSYTDDWTHVNDVDRIAPGRYLASVRNFDQVVVVDRETGEITTRLGSDGDPRTLYRQHNPQYLESEAGRPTILVADSENDRVVEYERRAGEWHRTWRVGGEDAFAWPRDADRLPSGNTLITDSRNNRVVEVTPRGEVVWEVYAPWLVYDAERVRYGDEAGGPTIRDQGATGSYDVTERAWGEERQEACAAHLNSFENPETVSPTTPEPTRTGDEPTAAATPGGPGDTPKGTARPATGAAPGRSTAVILLSLSWLAGLIGVVVAVGAMRGRR